MEIDIPDVFRVTFEFGIFISFKDITVDSVAIRILHPSELGAGNTVQVKLLIHLFENLIEIPLSQKVNDLSDEFEAV